MALRHRTFNRLLVVDDCLGHCVDAVLSGRFREFSCFNAVGRNEITFYRELVRQADRPRTMGSRGSDENFQVNRLVHAAEFLFAFRC